MTSRKHSNKKNESLHCSMQTGKKERILAGFKFVLYRGNVTLNLIKMSLPLVLILHIACFNKTSFVYLDIDECLSYNCTEVSSLGMYRISKRPVNFCKV